MLELNGNAYQSIVDELEQKIVEQSSLVEIDDIKKPKKEQEKLQRLQKKLVAAKQEWTRLIFIDPRHK